MNERGGDKYSSTEMTSIEEECGRDAEPVEFFSNQGKCACYCIINVSDDTHARSCKAGSRQNRNRD